MKSKHVTIIGGLVLIVLVCWMILSFRPGTSSASFAGTAFHGETLEDCLKVYSEFDEFLKSENFSAASSPAEDEIWAGVNSDEQERFLYTRETDSGERLYLQVRLGPKAMRTSVRWESEGYKGSVKEAELEAYKLALVVDDWISKVPERNVQPERLKIRKTNNFKATVEELQKG